MKLPVKPKDKCNYTDKSVIEIIDETGDYIATVRNVGMRDDIVQAINSYEKFKTALEVISDHEDHRKNAGVGYDSMVDEYAKQALKTEKS